MSYRIVVPNFPGAPLSLLRLRVFMYEVRKFGEGDQDASRCTMCNYCAIMIEKEPLRCWNGRLPQSA